MVRTTQHQPRLPQVRRGVASLKEGTTAPRFGLPQHTACTCIGNPKAALESREPRGLFHARGGWRVRPRPPACFRGFCASRSMRSDVSCLQPAPVAPDERFRRDNAGYKRDKTCPTSAHPRSAKHVAVRHLFSSSAFGHNRQHAPIQASRPALLASLLFCTVEKHQHMVNGVTSKV